VDSSLEPKRLTLLKFLDLNICFDYLRVCHGALRMFFGGELHSLVTKEHIFDFPLRLRMKQCVKVERRE
jgi:hypothetical protein